MSKNEPHRGHSPVLQFGDIRLARGISGLEVRTALNEEGRAAAVVSLEALSESPVDYRSVVRVEVQRPDGEATAWFGGWVTRATVSESGVALDMRNMEMFRQARFAGWSTLGIPAPELVWTLGRFAGMPPQSLHIQGFRPFREPFEVMMPVSGFGSSGTFVDGLVVVDRDADQARSQLARLTKIEEDGIASFLAPGGWATAKVTAETLFDAEREGAALIQGALDRIALEAHYSFAVDAEGKPKSFNRDDLFINPRHSDSAVVRGMVTGRTWYHVLTDLPIETALAAPGPGFRTPNPSTEPRFDEALRAWRRAANAAEPIEAATALSEAIEFYVAKTSVPSLFSDEEIAAIQDSWKALSLTDEQRGRLNGLAGRANEPPLFVRLLAALRIDGVPYSDGDIAAARRVRDYRNDFAHGRARGAPKPEDLEAVKGFVCRMLVFRGQRVAQGSANR